MCHDVVRDARVLGVNFIEIHTIDPPRMLNCGEHRETGQQVGLR
jgi:hypothetical protein